ncbi:MAG: biosynthetic peptidoglycan transglycosylase, partial [Nitrospinota bacterium]|nr:biosynthetic peptidoglycan transglycosylase [Nitrospinota bacterium]
QATLAIEDNKFYSHFGIDLKGLLRALYQNVRAGRVVQGGSTITQQLAKVLFLTPERSLVRKVKEALLALRIERAYSKEEILAL